jgi:hypothetical protein
MEGILQTWIIVSRLILRCVDGLNQVDEVMVADILSVGGIISASIDTPKAKILDGNRT